MPVKRNYENRSSSSSFLTPTSISSDEEEHENIIVSRPPSRPRVSADPYTIVPRAKRKKKESDPCLKTRDDGNTVNGIELKPTVVFDTFWYFTSERKLVDDRRRAGLPQPWTEDVILQKYHFCNTFRVLDKLSQYIIREVIEKGSQKPEELAFRIILFNLFTKIETWELLQHEVGPLKWETYNRESYASVLYKAKVTGQTIYTGAFQKPFPRLDPKGDSFYNHLLLLETLMENEVYYKAMHAWHMADFYEWLISFPSMGEFSTYQLMLNLSYSKLLNFHCNDFVVPGPGAISGLKKMFGKSLDKGIQEDSNFGIEVIRWLTDNQKYHFERLGLEVPLLSNGDGNGNGNGRRKSSMGTGMETGMMEMNVADIEHALCELDKYARLAHTQIKGRRTELRRSFEPKTKLSSKPALPKAWKDSNRKQPKIRLDKKLVVEKRYQVDFIKKHRNGKEGKEYLVHWWLYSDHDDTWEPEVSLIADAPGAVKSYWAKLIVSTA